MAHSVYNHISAVQEANRLADIEKYRANVHYTDWIMDKKNKGTNEFSPYVPYHVVYFDSFAQEVLDPKCPDPFALIKKHKRFLDEISFGTLEAEKVVHADFFDQFEGVSHDESRSREEIMLDPAMTSNFTGE
jgi:hypothetical protein